MRTRAAALRRAYGSDDGQLTILVLGFAVILLMLVTLVTDASKIFLAQRSLSGAADAAAVAGANAVDEGAVYTGQAGDALPLTSRSVRNAVDDYAAAAGLDRPDRFTRFAVATATTQDGVTATVTLRATVPLPFAELLPREWRRGYPLAVTAQARSPLAD